MTIKTNIHKIIEIYNKSKLSISKFASIIGKDRRTLTSWIDKTTNKEPSTQVKEAICSFFRYPNYIWNEECQDEEFLRILTQVPQDEVFIIDDGYLGGLRYKLEKESEGRLVVQSQFPGPVYRDSIVPRVYRNKNSIEIEKFKTMRKEKMLSYNFETTEWYSIKSLLSFCFSDIGNFYTKEQKIKILDLIIMTFQENYNKSLYLFDSYSRKIYGLDTAYTSIQMNKGTMFFKAPLDSVFLEIRNKKLVQRIHRHFTHGTEAPSHVNPNETTKILAILKNSIIKNETLIQAYNQINKQTNYGGLFYNNISLNLQKKLSRPKADQKFT